MKRYTWLLWVVMGFVSACGAGFQAGTDVQSGRLAFSIGNYQMARSYFAQAQQADPITSITPISPGGRSRVTWGEPTMKLKDMRRLAGCCSRQSPSTKTTT